MASIPAPPVPETMDQHVARLLRSWREETAFLSSSTQITAHSAYQELLTLGPLALLPLLRDLEQTEDGHLSKALTNLTGADPVPIEDRGRIHKIAEAWLHWARENGHLW